MAVTLRGHTFYSESEVSAMIPSGTVDSQWETYDMPIPSTVIKGWQGNKFHVNKITGLVVGWVAMQNLNKLTSTVVGTNVNLAPHKDMHLKYTGQYEYGTCQDTAPVSYMMTYKEMNGIWNEDGTLSLEGTPVNTSYIPYMGTFIEHYAHIGSKYGKITTTDVEQPIYLEEGAFYNQNTADLITGHAWLRMSVPLPEGYSTTNSAVICYKNLWSGEIIMQYTLHPTTAGTCPAITLPARCAVVNGRNFYTDARYVTGYTTAAQRQNTWMRINNNVLTFSAPSSIWVTGTQYYPGTPEIRPHNKSYEVTPLWLPESSVPIPSANNKKWPSTAAASTCENPGGSGAWFDTTYYKGRTGIDNWTWFSKRTGMVFTSIDMTTVGTTLPRVIFGSSSTWNVNFLPSYRYNSETGKSVPVYFSGAGYIRQRLAETSDATPSEYTCNLYFMSGNNLGTVDSTVENSRLLMFGTSGNLKPVAGNLACFVGYYLGNYAGNIVQ